MEKKLVKIVTRTEEGATTIEFYFNNNSSVGIQYKNDMSLEEVMNRTDLLQAYLISLNSNGIKFLDNGLEI